MAGGKAEALVALDGVSRVHGHAPAAVHALRNVSLAVAARDCLAIVGPSGSGKSTLLNIMGLLDTPTSGEVFVSGVRTNILGAEARARLRREMIGFVFQAPNLIARLSALRNVELPLVYRGYPPAEREKLAREALRSVGLESRTAHLPAELSGGQQQRVAIARAVVARPRILIADEPTGALDTVSGKGVLAILHDLNTSYGMAIIVVTHDAAIAERFPRIICVRDGAIAAGAGRGGWPHVA